MTESTYCWIASVRQSSAQKDISKDQCDSEDFASAQDKGISLRWALFGSDEPRPSAAAVDASRWQAGSDSGVEEVRRSAASSVDTKEGSAADDSSEGEAFDETRAVMPRVGPDTPEDMGTRKIVKNADMQIEVERIDRAMGRITSAAAELGGYVLETRSDTSEGHTGHAALTVAVPVNNFELMLARVRDSAVHVVNEYATGRDATQEYVDLESQIANLEATQARIRDFMLRAKSVEEALKVNAQLKEIEGQISQAKGRLRYLDQRAAYSTLSVELIQPAPPVTPTPTLTPEPTLTPTLVPTPVVEPWQPSETVGRATSTLTGVLQVLVELAIWLFIVVIPLLLPVLVIWVIARRLTRS